MHDHILYQFWIMLNQLFYESVHKSENKKGF